MNTFFVTSNILGFRRLLQSEQSARSFIDVLYHYRAGCIYLLHEFVVMPHHFHVILSPCTLSVEQTIQRIKGGFSYRMNKESGRKGTIWQKSFSDRRIRDAEEYERCREYLLDNPVKAGYVTSRKDWPYGSACEGFVLDDPPQRLKPLSFR